MGAAWDLSRWDDEYIATCVSASITDGSAQFTIDIWAGQERPAV
jgi:hypothetical protein